MASCYTYGYLDKVLSVTENDRTITYAYHPDGQIATSNYGDRSESFAWDQLAYCNNGVTGSVDLWGCWKGYTTDEIADTYAKLAKETIAGGDLARIKGVNEVTDNATLLRPLGIYYKIDKPFYEYHGTEWVTE